MKSLLNILKLICGGKNFYLTLYDRSLAVTRNNPIPCVKKAAKLVTVADGSVYDNLFIRVRNQVDKSSF